MIECASQASESEASEEHRAPLDNGSNGHKGTLLIKSTHPLGSPQVPGYRATVGSHGGLCFL
jgi:hypothetical protein